MHTINLIRIIIVLLSRRPATPITPSRLHLLQPLLLSLHLLLRLHLLEATMRLTLLLVRVVSGFLLGKLLLGFDGCGAGCGWGGFFLLLSGVFGLGLAADAAHEGVGFGGVFALLADGEAVFVEEEGEGEAGYCEESGDGGCPVDA